MLAVLAIRVVAVFTETLNFDEFALLQRAEISARTSQLQGGGRPGLATLLLIPLAAGCQNAVNALIHARLAWTGMVLASAAAFWFLLRAVLKPSEHRSAALALGLGLWVLAPAFLRFSTQIRADQPAILAGLLGGLALIASLRRPGLAALAGLLFGLGFLFTQKLLYVAGLVGALAVGQHLIHRDWELRREMLRASLAAAMFLFVVIGYRLVVMQQTTTAPALMPVTGAMNTFQHYRETIGWYPYLTMLPMLASQLMAVLCLPVLAADWLRSRQRHGPELLVGCMVLVLGLLVMFVHAGRFPYFYMVLGLFPATIGALVAVPVLERLARPHARFAFLAVLWTPLLAFALYQAVELMHDRQSQQRDSLAFVQRNFPLEARGFSNLAAFACRQEDDPFPVWFHEHVRPRFEGEPAATENTRLLIQEFRDRPVAFMIQPMEWEPFTPELRDFWRTRYVHYHGAIHVAGRRITGGPGTSVEFEVIAPGEYVWRPSPGQATLLELDGAIVNPGSTVVLDQPGVYELGLPAGGDGMLVLALRDPPAPDPRPFFWTP